MGALGSMNAGLTGGLTPPQNVSTLPEGFEDDLHAMITSNGLDALAPKGYAEGQSGDMSQDAMPDMSLLPKLDQTTNNDPEELNQEAAPKPMLQPKLPQTGVDQGLLQQGMAAQSMGGGSGGGGIGGIISALAGVIGGAGKGGGGGGAKAPVVTPPNTGFSLMSPRNLLPASVARIAGSAMPMEVMASKIAKDNSPGYGLSVEPVGRPINNGGNIFSGTVDNLSQAENTLKRPSRMERGAGFKTPFATGMNNVSTVQGPGFFEKLGTYGRGIMDKVRGAKPELAAGLDKVAPELAEKYGINTPERMRHFLAQTAHESAGFKTAKEYASGKEYEGRRDLGNTQPGDGQRYKGRGVIQLTGRANYKTYGDKLGIDLVNNPELAANPEVAWKVAGQYWQDHKLNELADRGDIVGITRRINGGTNGLKDRKRYYAAFGN